MIACAAPDELLNDFNAPGDQDGVGRILLEQAIQTSFALSQHFLKRRWVISRTYGFEFGVAVCVPAKALRILGFSERASLTGGCKPG